MYIYYSTIAPYKEGYSTWLSSRPQNQPRSWSPVYGLLRKFRLLGNVGQSVGLLCEFRLTGALSPCLVDVLATIWNASHSIKFNMDNGN